MKHLAPFAFTALLLVVACTASVDLNNRSCPCATGWQCCSNDLCVPEGATCGSGLALPPYGDGGGLAGGDATIPADPKPVRTLLEYCDDYQQREAKCSPDAGRKNCSLDFACVYQGLAPSVVDQVFRCASEAPCGTKPKCNPEDLELARTAEDTAFADACAPRVTACNAGGLFVSQQVCRTPLSALAPSMRLEVQACFEIADCTQLKSCLAKAYNTRGCDGY